LKAGLKIDHLNIEAATIQKTLQHFVANKP
jgi:hypothetical protein